ncbi:hypothetical protein EPUS_06875 [Endocarpon pusillum Z07020]|uniref:Uncharacterized protein n=1 Tax=Endocarpon pusillum (strain Z07020 / HMAS-L-300199) TaxID=1263415 RepID=U1GH44_ENDPU|nr:uncharacterized protein EPUS_06875 [Endocarpon pusillum Z07020]ERF77007.1 hypothetical protein EPUS_06875 [Endocarpon pusillum Z07020]
MAPTAEAYVVEIPIKLASKALNILKPVLSTDGRLSNSYPFLRRFVTTPRLPPTLGDGVLESPDDHATIHLLIPPPLPLNSDDITTVLRPNIHSESLPIIRTTLVPLDPPTTVEQAALWSERYWPCTFNPASQTIQKAPPLRILRTTQAELDKPANLKSYFSLAERAAAECADGALGRRVAAVIVDPEKLEVLAVASDARWYGQRHDPSTAENHHHNLAEGRPEHHALMRAIAMVAEKEAHRGNDNENSRNTAAEEHTVNLGGRAVTLIERLYAQAPHFRNHPHQSLQPVAPNPQSAPRPDVYLCNGLDVYLTHEPCVACSMAMIHSRFRVCVFRRRMPKTGGLWAEKDDLGSDGKGLGYGLFWRRELNWRVLTFQYLPPLQGGGEDGCGEAAGVGENGAYDGGAAVFHA